jgi:hypothetical protein
MTFQLRRFYRSIAQATLILGFSGIVHAAYPDKPIKLIVPYPPGGATDVIGRILAKNLGESLGQQVLVENRSGAGGNIGAEAVAKATPDGYTLLMGAVTSHSTMATLEKGKLRYDILKDFAPVMIVGSVPLVVVVNPNVPVRTLKGLVDYAKANPDRVGKATNITSINLFCAMSGLDPHTQFNPLSEPAAEGVHNGRPQVALDFVLHERTGHGQQSEAFGDGQWPNQLEPGALLRCQGRVQQRDRVTGRCGGLAVEFGNDRTPHRGEIGTGIIGQRKIPLASQSGRNS